MALLGGYRGVLQCDGYRAYKELVGAKVADPSITLACCWSHVRRGFYDLAKAKAPTAIEALRRLPPSTRSGPRARQDGG